MIPIHSPHPSELRTDIERAQMAATYARGCLLEPKPHEAIHVGPHDYAQLARRLECHVLTQAEADEVLGLQLVQLAGLLSAINSGMLSPRELHAVAGAAVRLSTHLLASMEEAE